MATAPRSSDETLSGLLDELKRDGQAWFSAEQMLLEARVRSGVKRAEFAILAIIGIVVLTFAGVLTLANVLVQLLAAWLGQVASGVIVGVGLLLAAAALGLWIRSLLRTGEWTRRTRKTAKVIWSALNEPD